MPHLCRGYMMRSARQRGRGGRRGGGKRCGRAEGRRRERGREKDRKRRMGVVVGDVECATAQQSTAELDAFTPPTSSILPPLPYLFSLPPVLCDVHTHARANVCLYVYACV
mmetsp:Transcript_43456/g.113117  ORF Transcript_43456/g.113117 Transcript_43456/m.113117 type:complete len:111 (+) Transcript_43456:611-943(+)